MLSITSTAANQIRALLTEKNLEKDHGLRLSIEKGGCAGLQYVMNLAPQQPGDTIIKSEDAFIFIDAKSTEQLSDCTIDYEEGLTGHGFRIINPRAARSCGCGTSFEPQQ